MYHIYEFKKYLKFVKKGEDKHTPSGPIDEEQTFNQLNTYF